MSPRATQTHEQKQKPGTSLCSTGACSGMVPGMHSASDFENTGPNCAALLLLVRRGAGLAANSPAWGLQPHSSPAAAVGFGSGHHHLPGLSPKGRAPRAGPHQGSAPKGGTSTSTGSWLCHAAGQSAGHPLFRFKSAHFLDVLCQFKKDLNFTEVKRYESETRGVAGYIKMVLICL